MHPHIKDGKLNDIRRKQKCYVFDSKKFLLTQDELNIFRVKLEIENKEVNRLLGANFCDSDFLTNSGVDVTLEGELEMYSKHSAPGIIALEIFSFIESNSSISALDLLRSSRLTADLYRDLAIYYEKKNPLMALDLMQKAQELRPSGASSIINLNTIGAYRIVVMRIVVSKPCIEPKV